MEGRDRAKAIEQARAQYGSDDLEIDDDAKLSEADNGTWVAAWVWVAAPRLAAMGLHVVTRWPDKPAKGEPQPFRVFGPFKTGEYAENWIEGRRILDGDTYAYLVHPIEAPDALA